MPISGEKTAQICQKVARVCSTTEAVVAAYVFGTKLGTGMHK